MRKARFILMLLGWMLAGSWGHATIYGENSLHDVRTHADARVRDAGLSVAVEVLNSSLLEPSPEGLITLSTTTPENRSICEGEPFLKQPVAGVCTGSLIAPDLILTAGHCMGGGLNCSTAQWVFDYQTSEKDPSKITVPASSVYKCKGLVAAHYEQRLDYAIVQLERPVLDRPVLKIGLDRPVTKGQELIAITAPYGLTLKTSVGFVRDASQENFFSSNLDVMRGSSGGPVFDVKTMEIIGIVARGENDLEAGPDPALVCNVFKRCENDACRGEDATRVSKIPYLRKKQ